LDYSNGVRRRRMRKRVWTRLKRELLRTLDEIYSTYKNSKNSFKGKALKKAFSVPPNMSGK
jgi:hypothetical protein